VRQFVFIQPDYFVVYDRVTSVRPDQQKVFLLHTQNKPIEVDDAWRGSAGEGALFMKTLLPTRAKAKCLGGDGQEFLVNGVNYPADPSEKPLWMGRYRIEISPAEAAAKTRFLTVLQAALAATPKMVATHLVQTDAQDGVELATSDGKKCRVLFNRDGPIGGHIQITADDKTLIDQPLLKPLSRGPAR